MKGNLLLRTYILMIRMEVWDGSELTNLEFNSRGWLSKDSKAGEMVVWRTEVSQPRSRGMAPGEKGIRQQRFKKAEILFTIFD